MGVRESYFVTIQLSFSTISAGRVSKKFNLVHFILQGIICKLIKCGSFWRDSSAEDIEQHTFLTFPEFLQPNTLFPSFT